ncbi:MAG TPA: alpha-hydroxy acid oxidase [Steroidobacteraceae bacterium]
MAQRRLPAPLFDYLEGGAGAETTLRANTAAFEEVRFIPRALVNVASVNTATTLLGQRIDWPVLCAPTGGARQYHPAGELAVARAAARSGVYYSLSVAGTHTIEQVAQASRGPKLFQILILKDRGHTRDLLDRCRASGYHALCLTVDAALRGKRERELRSGLPLKPTWSSRARCLLRPRWCLRQLLQPPLDMPNLVPAGKSARGLSASAQYLKSQLDPSISWADLEQLTQHWRGPLLLKGILSADDARRAVRLGVTAIAVSNHGGRQLDGAPASLHVLDEIVQAIGSDAEVIVDGGIRRGEHILAALALGAKACAIGRPYLYGLSAAGEPGVDKALDLLKEELITTMRLCGCTDVSRVDASLLLRKPA